jgi:predicted transposase/invertase (TIGR01784 family)
MDARIGDVSIPKYGEFEVMADNTADTDDGFEAGFNANRKYKDSVFTLLFGNKEALRQVCEAMFGKGYSPYMDIVLMTVKNVFRNGRLNDLSFVLDDKLVVLIEHQSTINENMPLRMLFYIVLVYEEYLREFRDKDILYTKNMFTIPEPVFIVFHVGDDMPEEKRILRLSDMFVKSGLRTPESIASLELVVTVYNMNKGHNPEIAQQCPLLGEYATFIFMVQENQKNGMSREDAIRKAVLDCINQNVLKEFLEQHRGEVVSMLFEEWNLDDAVAVAKKDGEVWGRKKGMEGGKRQQAIEIAQKMKARGDSIDEIIELTGLTVDDILPL